MKTANITLYQFSELNKEAQQKALDYFGESVIEPGYEHVYEDAQNIGLKIHDEPYKRCKGEFILTPPECAEKITSEHGTDCNTYRIAKAFLMDLELLTGQHDEIQNVKEEDIEALEDKFLTDLLKEYSIILKDEYEYQTSEKSTIEFIEANDYYFFADGSLANCTTYTDGHEKAGTTELNFHSQILTL